MPLYAGSRKNSASQTDKEYATLDLAEQLAATHAELAALQERYDALRVDRDHLAQELTKKMKKYKRFHQWVFVKKREVTSKATHISDPEVKCASGSTPASQQQPAVKMLETPQTPTKLRLTCATVQPSPSDSAILRRSPLSPNKHVLNTPRRRRTLSEGSPSLHHLKRMRDENEDTFVEEMSQTQEDSQALSFWRPSTPSQREHMKRHSLLPCPPTPRPRSPGLHSPPLAKRPRRSVEPISGSVSAPVQIRPVSRYRGSHSGEPPALNAEFKIDPMANSGVPFAFDEVVRGRRHRHRLNAGECEECRGWYAAVGPLPPRLEAPRWSSLSPRPSSPTLVESEATSHDGGVEEKVGVWAGTDLGSFVAGVSAHRQAVSRHRVQWERAPTPPGYWDIGFPDTQAVKNINEQAAELHRQKRKAIEKEVKEEGGRYRRRA